MSDKVHMTYQIGGNEPKASECDGLIVIDVNRKGYSGLEVGVIIEGLTYDEVCRAFVAANVSAWNSYIASANPLEEG